MAASLVGAGKAPQAHFKNGPPSSKRRGIESRRRFTFPSPTWPRGREGGSRQAPPTPGRANRRGQLRSRRRAAAGPWRTRRGHFWGTCCHGSSSSAAAGALGADPGRAVAEPPPPQLSLGGGPGWVVRRAQAEPREGTLGEWRTRGSEAEGSDELPFVVRRARARGPPAAQDRLAYRHVSRRRPGPTGHLPPGPR